MKNQKGFTLIEMLIVLMIISILLILIVPNLADKNEDVQDKGCEALLQMAESQMQAYFIDNGTYPASIAVLIEEEYLKESECAGGTKQLTLSGKVVSYEEAPAN